MVPGTLGLWLVGNFHGVVLDSGRHSLWVFLGYLAAVQRRFQRSFGNVGDFYKGAARGLFNASAAIVSAGEP